MTAEQQYQQFGQRRVHPHSLAYLRLKLGTETRVGQASDEVHHELRVEVHDLIRHVDGHFLALDDELFLHHGVEHGVNVLLDTCVRMYGAQWVQGVKAKL